MQIIWTAKTLEMYFVLFDMESAVDLHNYYSFYFFSLVELKDSSDSSALGYICFTNVALLITITLLSWVIKKTVTPMNDWVKD